MNQPSFTLAQTGLNLLPSSLVYYDGSEYGAAVTTEGIKLAVLNIQKKKGYQDFQGDIIGEGKYPYILCLPTYENIAALRARLPWLQPCLLGLRTSAGMGDRLGFATPGHVRAIQKTGGKIAPIFAQQSIREMTRTGRTPRQVMDDATWGVFQTGWQGGYGADADHLKTPEDIDCCLAAGFTFFTIDPGAYVNNSAESASLPILKEMAEDLPGDLHILENKLLGQVFEIEGMPIHFDEITLYHAMVKYGKAIWGVVWMVRHLEYIAGAHPFELEISVDETDLPTSHAEHLYIASELKRLGVEWTSLAPRFVGRFEKGVDYIGDLSTFEADIAGHAAIARAMGPYKLSLHSGSDKFGIYPAAMRQTRGLVHLKTAGTSYLEALRTIAELEPDFFRQIYTFARERYETDRVSYHVSARLDCSPSPGDVTDWRGLLDQFDAREILHVTFGSVLTEQNPDGTSRFQSHLIHLLNSHPEAYAANLEKHFIRHLMPFVAAE